MKKKRAYRVHYCMSPMGCTLLCLATLVFVEKEPKSLFKNI